MNKRNNIEKICSHPNKNKSLKDIIINYKKYRRKFINPEIRYYKSFRSFKKLLKKVAFCIESNGNRHSHHYRKSYETLTNAYKILFKKRIRIEKVKTFNNLYSIVKNSLKNLSGVNSLYYYDVSLHLGYYLNLRPKKIYLHTGTFKGLKALGIKTKQDFVLPSKLPYPFNTLPAEYLEDILCMYKEEFVFLTPPSSLAT